MRFLKLAGLVVLTLAACAYGAYLGRHEIARMNEELPQFTAAAGETQEERIVMQDGVKLFATVMLPKGEGPFPAILVRNPYAKFATIIRDSLCGRFVRYGYACVLQDVRGQGESEGEWSPMVNEVGDGRETINWLVGQAFQDGNIAMVGPSYLASVQYAVAASGLPEEVKTLIPAVYTTDLSDVLYSNGMFRHETFTAWASMMRGANSDIDDAGGDYQKAIKYLPHNKVDTDVFGVPMPWYQDMIDVERAQKSLFSSPDALLIAEVPERIEVPILMVSGWYDVFFGGQMADWERLATRSNSRFILGPWTHMGDSGEAFEIENAEGGLFQWKEMLPWLEHHLKGKPLEKPPGLYAFTMGENEWHYYKEWPGPIAKQTFSLNKLLDSTDCDGGELALEEGLSEPVSYQYDPLDPVPTKGGAGMLAFILPGFEGASPANVLQDGLCDRQDVLTFVTSPLESPMLIAGQISVNLEVSSSAPDTAFTAKLIEVFLDGSAVNIRDNITSLAYRDGGFSPREYTSGESITLKIDMWPIEWRVSKGSRIRLDISSSDFPKFHAHRNRAGPWAEQNGVDVATQTLFGGTLELPVSAR
jgi:putative CocE/NonD family hydrolase